MAHYYFARHTQARCHACTIVGYFAPQGPVGEVLQDLLRSLLTGRGIDRAQRLGYGLAILSAGVVQTERIRSTPSLRILTRSVWKNTTGRIVSSGRLCQARVSAIARRPYRRIISGGRRHRWTKQKPRPLSLSDVDVP